MTAVDRDPVALAREVLDLTHEDETVTVCSVPDNKVAALARAVIAVADLADLWESVVSSYDYEAAMQNAAMDLRTALSGGTA